MLMMMMMMLMMLMMMMLMMLMLMLMLMLMMLMMLMMMIMMDHINVQDNPIHPICFPRAAHRRRCVNLLNQIQAIRTLGPFDKRISNPGLSEFQHHGTQDPAQPLATKAASC